ncbi:hypothetical protein BOX15_Mlig031869g1, partial [Macrostomum lignano]
SASASSGFSMSSSWRSLADTVLAGWPIDYDLLEPDVPAISEADIAKRMCGLPFKPVDDVTRPTPAETVRNLSRPDPESGRLMQLPAIPSAESARSMKRQRRAERLRTAGKNWFGLPRQETDEAQAQALEVLQMRRALDTKTFYKRNDRDKPARYYQVGTFEDRPEDYYSSRTTRKQRRADVVDELLASEDFMKKLRVRYRKIHQARIAESLRKANKLKRLTKKQKSRTTKAKGN